MIWLYRIEGNERTVIYINEHTVLYAEDWHWADGDGATVYFVGGTTVHVDDTPVAVLAQVRDAAKGEQSLN